MKKFLLFAILIGIFSIIGCKEKTAPITQDEIIVDIQSSKGLQVDASATLIQIRYYDTRTPNVKRTTELFNPEGEPMGIYRLTHNSMSGDQLYAWLVDQGFLSMVPVYNPPQKYITVKDTITDENGNLVIGDVQVLNPQWDPDYQSHYLAARAELFLWMSERMELQQAYSFPKIPDGPTIKWEFVDMSKPPRERYTPTIVEPGKYNGDKWKADWNSEVMQRFAYWASKKSSPELAAKWIAGGKLVY